GRGPGHDPVPSWRCHVSDLRAVSCRPRSRDDDGCGGARVARCSGRNVAAQGVARQGRFLHPFRTRKPSGRLPLNHACARRAGSSGMTFLLPRLPGPACDVIVRRFLEHGPSAWAGFRSDDLPDQVRFAATGGAPVPAGSLASVRQELVAIARKHGFGQQGARQSHAGFDAEAAAWLARSDLFTTGEALRDDVWAFVAAVMAPDITYWRFGNSTERYAGGVRNTFQRLWMRGRALDRGPGHPERWGLLDALTEDALVQITARPSIGGDHVRALAVAEAWLPAARHHGKGAMEDLMRRAI